LLHIASAAVGLIRLTNLSDIGLIKLSLLSACSEAWLLKLIEDDRPRLSLLKPLTAVQNSVTVRQALLNRQTLLDTLRTVELTWIDAGRSSPNLLAGHRQEEAWSLEVLTHGGLAMLTLLKALVLNY